MQKFVRYIFVLFFVACIAACGGGGSTAATAVYKLPTSFASYSASKMGGAISGGAIASSAKFSNFSVSLLAGTPGSIGSFANYTGNSTVTAKFNQPNDITTDGADFYVADYGNNAIRLIHTDAVSGVVKSSTLQCIDKVTKAAIVFYQPSGITTDGIYLYVADRGYNRIRVITIVPDTGTNLHEVVTIGSTTGVAGSFDSTDKTAVLFNQPTGITTDGKNVYVTDYGNATVRWFNTSGVINDNYAVYTLAGASGAIGSANSTGTDSSTARFNLPTRITTDGTNLYVTDVLNRTIRQIVIRSNSAGAAGTVTTLAGRTGQLSNTDNGSLDGVGTAASFREPNGITTDGTNLYVTDSSLAIIRKIVIATGTVTTLPLLSGSLLGPFGITTDGTSLFVADTYFVSRDPETHIDTYTYSNSILRIR